MTLDKQAIKEKTRRVLDPVVVGLSSLGVPPILISVFGLVFSFYGAILVAKGSLFWGGIWLLISGVCDILDGAVARHRGQATKFGAFIDSTFDRISELVYFGAILVYFANRAETYSTLMTVIIWIALGGSFLVSYARARIEGLGYPCTIGLLERPERLTLLILGLLLGHRMLSFTLTLIAFGTVITVLQRVHYAHEVTQGGVGGTASAGDAGLPHDTTSPETDKPQTDNQPPEDTSL
ncbi:MAG: CDP-alcohol phosphatidyltransferase family protein [Candidatus Latescibacterota bacterium]|nr:MAG: CDP-alcohol phosphatidyltransferase family protein [Candidatus Latescibacterota bacterium]